VKHRAVRAAGRRVRGRDRRVPRRRPGPAARIPTPAIGAAHPRALRRGVLPPANAVREHRRAEAAPPPVDRGWECRDQRGGACANPQVGDCAASRGASQIDPGCAKTRAFNLLVESSSQFGQSENQKCWRRLSEEDDREKGSTLSWLAHVFTRPGPLADIRPAGD
jgi:hypothetical protein